MRFARFLRRIVYLPAINPERLPAEQKRKVAKLNLALKESIYPLVMCDSTTRQLKRASSRAYARLYQVLVSNLEISACASMHVALTCSTILATLFYSSEKKWLQLRSDAAAVALKVTCAEEEYLTFRRNTP
jgi:hypothetical protein